MGSSKLLLLQSLRGVATLLVLLFHLTVFTTEHYDYDLFFGIFNSGYMGVDLFFVLSGFIIYFIHSIDIGHRNRLNAFLMKRFIRIYPVYWIVLFGMTILYLLIPNSGKGYETEADTMLRSFTLFPQPHHAPTLTVAWTLTYEVIFYLLFASIIVFSRRLAYILLSIWVIGIVAFFFIDGNYLAEILFNGLNLEFLFGCAIGHIFLNISIRYYRLFLIAGVTCALISAINDHTTFTTLHRAFTYGISSALILIGFVAWERSRDVRPLSALTYLGDASYSIYLTHYPAITILEILMRPLKIYSLLGVTPASILLLFLTITIGCVFHSFVEKPVLSFIRNKFMTSRVKADKGTVPAAIHDPLLQ